MKWHKNVYLEHNGIPYLFVCTISQKKKNNNNKYTKNPYLCQYNLSFRNEIISGVNENKQREYLFHPLH